MQRKKDKSIETLKIKFQEFFDSTGRYPTQNEISKNLGISARTLQREYGSLKTVRSLIGLETLDFTTGKERSNKASKSFEISITEQNRIYKKILPIFKEYYIHREAPFADTARQRSDFKIFHKEGGFYVDLYYASNYENMIGCINAKLKKYNPDLIFAEIILINTNKALDNEIERLIKNRKSPLPENIRLMNEKEFLLYCKTLTPIV